MLDISAARIDLVSVHRIGNRTNGEDLQVSAHPVDRLDKELDELLSRFFLKSLHADEVFNFSFSNGDHTLNPLFRYCSEIFDGTGNFHTNSVHMAKHLYEVSVHPMIKSGDLFVVYFSNLGFNHGSMDAIGIFKSENTLSSFRVEQDSRNFSIARIDQIQHEKPDKACLIINTGAESGYSVCLYDKSGKQEEAAFWKDQFLMLKPAGDEFHKTRDFLTIAKKFVTEQVQQDFEVNRTDQIGLLNKSMDYFKSRDSFNREEFEEEVFGDPALIDSFRKFDHNFRKENDIELEDQFDISLSAVKKQAKVFKSVLKLDRNFHIYIHGNKNLIEHGVEKDGRKFYKIYYDKET